MPNLSDVNFTKHVPIVIYFDMSVTSEVREKVRRRRVTRRTQRCEGSKRMYKDAVERGIGLLSSECTWGTNHFLGQLQSFCDKGGSAMNLRMFNTLLAPLCPICPYFHHVYCISRIYRPRSAYARLSAKNDVRNIACQIQRRTSIHRKFKYTCLETFFFYSLLLCTREKFVRQRIVPNIFNTMLFMPICAVRRRWCESPAFV